MNERVRNRRKAQMEQKEKESIDKKLKIK